jgi:two-component system chemotaxis response regulator CheB
MMASRRLRVLIADDSLTVRKRLADALASDADIEVVGEARDGLEAVSMCAALKPDVVTMDVVMPGLDGVQAAEEIMAQTPTPILVVSAAENRGERFSTLNALAAGAVEALEKPAHSEDPAAFDARLVRALKLVSRVPVVTRRRRKGANEPRRVDAPVLEPGVRREVVAIGGSTGGPGALLSLMRELPSDFPLPILVVLHIGQAFGFGMAEWLSTMSPLPVLEATHGARIQAGTVYLCPPDRHMVVRGQRLWLTLDPERHSCRPSVDVLFESVAEEYGARAVGCLLTGIGRDGAAGLLAMRARGALTVAQDEASCAVFGMPREAIARGAAAHVAAPAAMASLLSSASKPGRR